MKLLTMREIATILGVSYDTVRQYARQDRYPDFPAEKKCPTCNGVGHGRVQEEITEWDNARPGRGGGDLRADPRAAAKKAWATRRAG